MAFVINLCCSTYSIKPNFKPWRVITRASAFPNLQGSHFNRGHITCHPPRTDVLVKHSKDTMPHACSLRGHSHQPVPFVWTEYPHVACTYVIGHPDSRYWSLVIKLMLLFPFFSPVFPDVSRYLVYRSPSCKNINTKLHFFFFKLLFFLTSEFLWNREKTKVSFGMFIFLTLQSSLYILCLEV